MKNMGTIFFNFDSVKNEEGKMQISKFFALKTNEGLTLLSSFEKEINFDNYRASIQELLSEFELWVKNPYENKFVTFNTEDMKNFIEICKEVNYKSRTRDFHKIISYQYWNIQNEMTYRIGHRNENISLPELLELYGLDFVGNIQSAKDLCYNTYSLITHFKMDNKRNTVLFAKRQQSKKDSIEDKKSIPLCNLKPLRATGEEMLQEKLEEGWKVDIQCERSITGIEYKGIAIHPNSESKQAVGNTIESLMKNLFAV